MADFNFLQLSEQDVDGTKMRSQLAGWFFTAPKFDSDRLCKPGWKVMFGGPALYFFAIICSIVYKILVYCLSANPLALCIDESADFAYIAIDCQQVQRFNLDSFEVVQTINTGEEPDVMVILPDGFSKHWESN